MNLSLFDKLRLLSALNKMTDQIQKGINMKNPAMIASAIITLITTMLMNPQIQSVVLQFVSHHPVASIVIVGVGHIVTAITPNQNAQNS
jgi:hypothetical protein